MGRIGTGKTTLLNQLYERLNRVYNDNLVYCRQDITCINYGEDTIYTYVLKTNSRLYTAYQRSIEFDNQYDDYDYIDTE